MTKEKDDNAIFTQAINSIKNSIIAIERLQSSNKVSNYLELEAFRLKSLDIFVTLVEERNEHRKD